MSKSSIRFCLLAISCLFIVWALPTVGSVIRPTMRVTEVDRVDQHVRVQEEIYRYLSEGNTFDKAHFTWNDTATTNAAGYDTVYLGFHYASDNFFPVAMPTTVSLIAAFPISDSSFVVALFDAAGSGHSVYYRWHVEGAIE